MDIDTNLNKELKELYTEIDRKIDPIFEQIVNHNLDNFLDFHYSIIGEYTELGAMAMGNIEKSIEQRLLGTDFIKKIETASININKSYTKAAKSHLSNINQFAFQDIDLELNEEAITLLNNGIIKNMKLQGGKIGIIITARIIPKIIQVMVTKLSTKAITKVVLKATGKTAAKATAASVGATAGLSCAGIGAIVCSPVLATIAWFATDAIVVNTDEYLNREDFRKEIISLLDQQKELLKQEYKNRYHHQFIKYSTQIQEEIHKLPVKKRERIFKKMFN